jgi:hypothetical protein
MSKETYFFRHDYNARNDNKISALISDHGAAGYGIYWCIVEMLHEEENHKLQDKELTFRALAKQMSTSVELIKAIVNDCSTVYELLIVEDGFFYSNRVFKNIERRHEISESRSKAGKASAEKRAKRGKNSTSVEQVLTDDEQKATKERKEKEIKEKEKKEYLSATFNQFWVVYDKSVDKSKTENKWNSLTNKQRESALNNVAAYVNANPKKQFRKSPYRYLNDESWNDELIVPETTQTGLFPNQQPTPTKGNFNQAQMIEKQKTVTYK